MIIVTGCGRSGTYYMALALQALGFDVGHEQWGTAGQVGFHAAVDLRGAKKGKPWRLERDTSDIVLHQVRHPLGTISSFQTAQGYSWDFICEHEKAIDRKAPLVLRCMQYWYYWNIKASTYADLTYRIEEIEEAWPEICTLIGIPADTPRPKETHKGWHKRGHSNLTWADLHEASADLCLNIKTAAVDLGYSVDEEPEPEKDADA